MFEGNQEEHGSIGHVCFYTSTPEDLLDSLIHNVTQYYMSMTSVVALYG